MTIRIAVIALALFCAAAVFGCGGTSSGAATDAPATPGDAASLAGTAWVDPETGVEYGFAAGGTAFTRNPASPQAIPGSYTVTNGIVALSLGFQTFEGAWDGTALVLDGKTLTRQ